MCSFVCCLALRLFLGKEENPNEQNFLVPEFQYLLASRVLRECSSSFYRAKRVQGTLTYEAWQWFPSISVFLGKRRYPFRTRISFYFRNQDVFPSSICSTLASPPLDRSLCRTQREREEKLWIQNLQRWKIVKLNIEKVNLNICKQCETARGFAL